MFQSCDINAQACVKAEIWYPCSGICTFVQCAKSFRRNNTYILYLRILKEHNCYISKLRYRAHVLKFDHLPTICKITHSYMELFA